MLKIVKFEPFQARLWGGIDKSVGRVIRLQKTPGELFEGKRGIALEGKLNECAFFLRREVAGKIHFPGKECIRRGKTQALFGQLIPQLGYPPGRYVGRFTHLGPKGSLNGWVKMGVDQNLRFSTIRRKRKG